MPLSKAEYRKTALQLVKGWEKQLDGYNAVVLARQIKEWERVSAVFEKLILELSEKTNLSPNQLFKLEEYKRFAVELDKQLARYAAFNANLTSAGQGEIAGFGLQNSNTLLNLIDVNFSRLPVEAINKSIGLTADGSPLYDVLIKRFGERADEAKQLLIEGVATGRNPKLIARTIQNQLDISRYDATRIARTEIINTYNQVSYDNYKNSGIVEEYIWIAESDACPECLQRESESPYKLGTNIIPTEHPHCRCAIAPHL